jgi:hypothetical protein
MLRVIVPLAMFAALALPSVASAAVRSGATEDGVVNQDTTPTLQPRPVSLEVLRSCVTYDDVAGTVQISVTYNGAPGEGEAARVVLYGPEACASEELFPTEEGSVRALDLTLRFADGLFPDSPHATATLTGFDGTVTAPATVSPDGATITVTLSHPAFAHGDYRCVRGTGSDDGFDFYFAGFAPIKLTAANSTTAFVDHLTRRYGAAYTNAGRTYTKCAGVFTDADTGSQSAGCWAEFGTGRAWRIELVAARVEPEGFAVTMDSKPFVRKWTRRWRKAGTSCLKSWRMQGKGTLYANTGTCEAGLAFHFYKGRTFTGGTGSGYDPKVTSYPCKRRGRTYTCTNAMGDAIRWTPRQR